MIPLISVITPASKGIKHLFHLVRDFRNQTFQNFEHAIIWDGEIPEDVKFFMNQHKKDYNIRFCSITKDHGNMNESPGTNSRNHGISIAKGKYLIFFDDDDRARDTYLESFTSGLQENSITVVQMSCQQSRMYKNGDPNKIVLIPEIGLQFFPVVCHVGTPCFIVPKEWAIAEPWRHESEHDFRFIKRICERFKPAIRIIGGMQVDIDGLVIKNMKDWVSMPPFYRD